MVPVLLLGKILETPVKILSRSRCAYYGLEASTVQWSASLFHPSAMNKYSVHLNKPWPIKALQPHSPAPNFLEPLWRFD